MEIFKLLFVKTTILYKQSLPDFLDKTFMEYLVGWFCSMDGSRIISEFNGIARMQAHFAAPQANAQAKAAKRACKANQEREIFKNAPRATKKKEEYVFQINI